MRLRFFIGLFVMAAAVGAFAYFFVPVQCQVPMTYSIGELDEQFDLTHEEAAAALAEAAAIWEDATGTDLFVPVEQGGALTINFVFDERQQMENAESAFAARLQEGKSANDALTAAYSDVVTRYDSLLAQYNTKRASYEAALDTYNKTVDTYNRQGGAPEDEYNRLADEREQLAAEAASLSTQSEKLSALVSTINDLSTRGQELVAAYNADVAKYNNQFGDEREFTQGDYQNHQIHIYTFNSHDELVAVLAHELGHALSLDHVENSNSMMYYLMDKQPQNLSLTSEDDAEYMQKCVLLSWWQQWLRQLHMVVDAAEKI